MPDRQTGVAHLLLLVAVVGIVAFLIVASAAPFRNSLLSSIFPKSWSYAATPNDWPQVGRDTQHTAHSDEILGTNYRVKCNYFFQPERVYSQIQPIISSGLMFIGTMQGNLYALDAATCAKQWSYKAGGPILHAVAVDNGKIFFGSLDGSVYAVDFSGNEVWKKKIINRVGFSVAPIVADNKILIGGQDGYFYALDPLTGNIVWKYNTGSPILMTAAFNNGKVFFGTMDSFVYALNTSPTSTTDPTKILAWKSVKITGVGFKDYWPVVFQGKVIVRPVSGQWLREYGFPNVGFPFSTFGIDPTWLAQHGPGIAAGNASLDTDIMNAQNTAMANYNANPTGFSNNSKKSMFILDENTGVEAFTVPHWVVQTMNGAAAPPCVDKDNKLIVPVQFHRSTWGRLDLSTQRIVDILYDGKDWSGNPVTTQYQAGGSNMDENMAVTCTGNQIIANHPLIQGVQAAYIGAFDQTSRSWKSLGGGLTNLQMSMTIEPGGFGPAVVSNGLIYQLSWNEVVVKSTN